MNKHKALIAVAVIACVALAGAFVFPQVFATRYDDQSQQPVQTASEQTPVAEEKETAIPVSVVEHIATPKVVKAIYMSSWVGSTQTKRAQLIELIKRTEMNAVVLDIKDATGRVSFLVSDPTVADTGSPVNRIRDIDALIQELHDNDIYIIGRISVFQDPYLAVQKPEWAIRKKSDGGVWKDKKGLSFLSPTSRDAWAYTEALAKASYAKGFDEINFDYIRFPSDGDIKDIAYPDDPTKTRADFLEEFFKHLGETMRAEGIPTSADLFGMVTTSKDDLGIGQVLERALPHFDYIAPMVYPSHYPPNFIGIKNPASEPYAIIKYAMQSAVSRAAVLGYGPEKFRPWIQDFDMGATYTAPMVRAQITAAQELGIESWLVWDPANTYTEVAYLKE